MTAYVDDVRIPARVGGWQASDSGDTDTGLDHQVSDEIRFVQITRPGSGW